MTNLTPQQRAKLKYPYVFGYFQYNIHGIREVYMQGLIDGAQQWIKVEDKMPERDKARTEFSVDVIFTNELDTFKGYHYFAESEWMADNGEDVTVIKGVTRWMPAPELPK